MVVLMGGLGAIHSFSSHPKVFIHICAWMTEEGRSEWLFGLWRLPLIATSTNQIDCSRQLICLLPKRTALLEAIDSVILEFCLIEAAFRLILREALILAVPSISHLIRYPLQVVTSISLWAKFFTNSVLNFTYSAHRPIWNFSIGSIFNFHSTTAAGLFYHFRRCQSMSHFHLAAKQYSKVC